MLQEQKLKVNFQMQLCYSINRKLKKGTQSWKESMTNLIRNNYEEKFDEHYIQNEIIENFNNNNNDQAPILYSNIKQTEKLNEQKEYQTINLRNEESEQ